MTSVYKHACVVIISVVICKVITILLVSKQTELISLREQELKMKTELVN